MFQYRNVFVKISPEQIIRHDEKQHANICDGFLIEIFGDESGLVPMEIISAAVGYELSENSEDETEEFAKDYVDDMIEIYREMREET